MISADVTTYSIGGTVINDADKDGDIDEGEAGLAGAPVKLAWGCDGAVDTRATTAPDGSYALAYLQSGLNYCVSVRAPYYNQTSDSIQIDALSADVTMPDIFAYWYELAISPEIGNTLPGARLGQPYSQTITVSGGVAPYTFKGLYPTDLPTGLVYTIDEQAGTVTISGTPTEGNPGDYFPLNFFVTDANKTGRGWYGELSLYLPVTFTLSSLTNPTTFGQAAEFTVTAGAFDTGTPPSGTVIFYADGEEIPPLLASLHLRHLQNHSNTLLLLSFPFSPTVLPVVNKSTRGDAGIGSASIRTDGRSHSDLFG